MNKVPDTVANSGVVSEREYWDRWEKDRKDEELGRDEFIGEWELDEDCEDEDENDDDDYEG